MVSPAAAGAIETASESQTLIARIDAKLDIRVRARMTESEDGILRAVHVETDMSAQTTVTDVIIAGRTATIRERSGQASIHERAPPLEGR